MALFEVENLSYRYPDEHRPALDGVSLSIEEGDFVLLTGGSGGGKSSLLRALAGLLPDFYGGEVRGSIRYAGRELSNWDRRTLAREIGIVFQDPELQMLTTMVEQEIAFGLESLGLPPEEMRRRVAEALSFFGLLPLRQAFTPDLSGGQKQMTVLASVLAMHPKVLLLDEPTSQLDPVFAQDFLGLVQRLNLEFGMTVVLVEQRLDRCFHLADRVLVLEAGRLVSDSTPRQLANTMDKSQESFLPPIARAFSRRLSGGVPLTVKEGRDLLRQQAVLSPALSTPPPQSEQHPDRVVLAVKGLTFAFPQQEPCLKQINLSLVAGSITALMGDTGAGKSTLLKALTGLLRPQKGTVHLHDQNTSNWPVQRITEQIGYLSQNPNDYLFNDTVREEVLFARQIRGMVDDGWAEQLMRMLDIEQFAQINPRDLSGGERQRVALAAVLTTDPSVLLLDEPTRGLDNQLRIRLGRLLEGLRAQGRSILVVTHDVEFAAELAQRVLIMSDGEIIADGDTRQVLTNSLHYAPQVNRLFRGFAPQVVTLQEAVALLDQWLPPAREGEVLS